LIKRILGKVKRKVFPPVRLGQVQIDRQRLELGAYGVGVWTVDPTLLTKDSTVYCVGVGEDISFDLGLISRFGCTVHAMDPTPRSIQYVREQKPPEQFRMHEWGLAARDGQVTFYPPENPRHVSHTFLARKETEHLAITVQVLSLGTIMNRLGHIKLDLLKIDIEGAEYEVIDDIVARNYPITQLLIEFHHRFPQVGNSKTVEAIRKLNDAGYKIFAISESAEEYSFIRP
jgi:FkbM family methyltransferase